MSCQTQLKPSQTANLFRMLENMEKFYLSSCYWRPTHLVANPLLKDCKNFNYSIARKDPHFSLFQGGTFTPH